MAIIYSYPQIIEPQDSDLMLISDMGSIKKSTRSISLLNLADFINSKVNLSTIGDTGTGVVNLSTQSLSILGTSLEVETSAVDQTITIGLPDNVTITGNLTVNQELTVEGISTFNDGATFNESVNFLNTILDVIGAPGVDGQVLSSTGASVKWIDNTATGTVTGTGTTNKLPLWTDGPNSVLSDSGFYQSPPTAALTVGAIGLNTTILDSAYGEYPDFRVASRSLNDPGVLDLFRPDGDVVAGDRVGILQYSLDDDNQYTVAQIEVKTIGNSGTGNGGGGKLCIKTSSNGNGAQPTERLCIDNTEADFSVPVNVTSTVQSSFAGQVTIPITPIAGTDAASKAYVDLQNTGQVSGTGTTNTLPIWSDGPNGVLGDSGVRETRNAQGDISNIIISTSQASNPLNINFGAGGATSFKIGTTEFIRLTDQFDGFYTPDFRYKGKLTVDRDTNSQTSSLDVGDANHTYPAAWFRNGVVISNNPSGVQVDNTSMVIGSGDNDIISGSDNCLAVGKANQLTKSASGTGSDHSVAIGSQNTLIDAANSLAVGQFNVINGTGLTTNTARSQVFGFQNSLTGSYSSFIAGGYNTVTTKQNAVALGFSHSLAGQDSMFAFGENNTGPSGANDNNSFMIGGNLTGVDSSMVLGFRNDTSSYPTPNYFLGLGDTKFAIAVGSATTTNSNALIITEGGRFKNVDQVPRVLLPTIVGFNYANDTAATANGIPTGGLYRNGNDLKINFNETAAGGNEGLAYLTPQLLTASAGASGTIDPNYNLVLLSWTGGNGNYTLNLPLASANTNRLIRITTDGSLANGSGDKIDITATGGETIDGNPSFQISKQYEGLAVFSTGSEWIIVQAKAH